MTNSGTRPQEVADFYDGSSRLIAELNGGACTSAAGTRCPTPAWTGRRSGSPR
ncbi:hypothetical protein ACFQ3Z_36470 [Streptomyces nogalater]